MTGSQLKHYRTSKGWSLRALAEILKDVNFTTLSRWEQSEEEVPAWVPEKLFSSTEVTLPLSVLQSLMAYATQHRLDFSTLLATALREYLANRKSVDYTALPPIESARVAEDPLQ